MNIYNLRTSPLQQLKGSPFKLEREIKTCLNKIHWFRNDKK